MQHLLFSSVFTYNEISNFPVYADAGSSEAKEESMKKFLLSLLAVLMVFSLCACGQKAPEEAENGGEEVKETHSVIYFCRRLGDISYNDAGLEGVKAACDKYGWTYDYVELGDDMATFETAFVDALDSGDYDIVVTQNGSSLGDYCEKYSPDYPGIKFIFFDAVRDKNISGLDNVYGISYNGAESCFVAGAIAGAMTKTNTLGCITYGDNPGGNDFVTGWFSGLLYSNPEAKSYLAYGDSMPNGAPDALEVTNNMVASGADLVLGGSGRLFAGIVQSLTENGGVDSGLFAFGPDTDMYQSYSSGAQAEWADVILSSVLKNIKNSIETALDKIADGTIEWGTVNYSGIAEGGTDICVNDHFKELAPQEVQDLVNDIYAKIKSGELKVQSYFDFADRDAFQAWLEGTGALASLN